MSSDEEIVERVSEYQAEIEEREDMGIDAGPWTSAGAVFDDDFQYRYRLWREWDPKLPTCAFVMLNPSVADHKKLDPTVRRCIGFAKRWGCGRLEVVNAFAWIDGNPDGLYDPKDPIGPLNNQAIEDVCETANIVVAAWSYYVEDLKRLPDLHQLLRPFASKVYSLEYTGNGAPRHPLYLPADSKRELYTFGQACEAE